MLTNEQGFSLVETLFALLLFSLSFTALMHYQQALGLGFQQQWLQREAWRNAQQRLEGQQMPVRVPAAQRAGDRPRRTQRRTDAATVPGEQGLTDAIFQAVPNGVQ